jgi:hypothetical protein
MNRIIKPLIHRGLFFAVCKVCLACPFEPEVFEFPRPALFNFDVIIDLMHRSGDHPPEIFLGLGSGNASKRAKTRRLQPNAIE